MRILIKDGIIIDGTGKERYAADILTQDGKISRIGKLGRPASDKVIDAKGFFVTPGFIDLTTHSDVAWTLFSAPSQESFLRQGVTTITLGTCGSSLAPITGQGSINSIHKWAETGEVNINWFRMDEYLDMLEMLPKGVNMLTLIGHGTIRRGIIGDEDRELTEKELEEMERVVKDALEEGAFGLSTGLVFAHGQSTTMEEMVRLNRIVSLHDGLYATHLRGEGRNILAAIKEAMETAFRSGVRSHIAHLKIIGRMNWNKINEVLRLIETSDADISFDFYPYTGTGSTLYVFFPNWLTEGGKTKMISRLLDPLMRERALKEMREKGYEYDKVILADSPIEPGLAGRSVREMSENQNISPEEILLNVLLASEGKATIFNEILSEDNIYKNGLSAKSIVASNGIGESLSRKRAGEGLMHPRSFGAFPRFFRMFVKERKTLSWEDAVKKVSSYPASRLGLKDRGIILEGKIADLVIFNPDTFTDKADIFNPRYAEGLIYSILGGKIAIDNGVFNNKELAGIVIRKR